MKKRCTWVDESSEIYKDYHDNEWGRAVHDDRLLFEMLILEGAQAGLSWLTVLKKRSNCKELFADFNVLLVAKYDDKKVEELLLNSGIIRNRLKVNSAIKNAKVFIKIQEEFGSFSNYIWGFVGGKQIINDIKSIKELPAKTELSDKISKDLKNRGMNFVGSTIIYAYMQSIGIVNDHENNCFCKKEK